MNVFFSYEVGYQNTSVTFHKPLWSNQSNSLSAPALTSCTHQLDSCDLLRNATDASYPSNNPKQRWVIDFNHGAHFQLALQSCIAVLLRSLALIRRLEWRRGVVPAVGWLLQLVVERRRRWAAWFGGRKRRQGLVGGLGWWQWRGRESLLSGWH